MNTRYLLLAALMLVAGVLILAAVQPTTTATPPQPARPVSMVIEDANAYAIRADAETRSRFVAIISSALDTAITFIGFGVGIGVALFGLGYVVRQLVVWYANASTRKATTTQLLFIEAGRVVESLRLLGDGQTITFDAPTRPTASVAPVRFVAHEENEAKQGQVG